MEHTFRARPRHWIADVIALCLLLALTALLAIVGRIAQELLESVWPVFLILAILFLGAGIESIVPKFRIRLHLDDHTISGRVGRSDVMVNWSDVLMARLFKRFHHYELHLGTSLGVHAISLKHLDHRAIWDLVQSRVEPAALAEDAYKRLPFFKEGMAAAAQLVRETMAPLRVGYNRVLRVIGWIAIVVFSIPAVLSLRDREIVQGSCFFGFAAFGGLLALLGSGSLEMDAQKVARISFRGHYQITWDEIERIELNASGDTMLLGDRHTQLAIPGPALWSGADKTRMLYLLNAQIDLRDIEVKGRLGVLWFPWSKNARVPRKSSRR